MKLILPLFASALLLTMACYRHKQPERTFPVHNDSVWYNLNGHTVGYVYDTVYTKGWRSPFYFHSDTIILWNGHWYGAGFKYSPNPSPIPDTTKPGYRYFIRHENPDRYFKALDSLSQILSMTGKTMTRDQSDMYMDIAGRNLRVLYYEGKVDSIKIGK
jgi:hypothetical protein